MKILGVCSAYCCRLYAGKVLVIVQFMMYFLIATIFFVFPLAALGYEIWFTSIHYVEYGLISLLGLIE